MVQGAGVAVPVGVAVAVALTGATQLNPSSRSILAAPHCPELLPFSSPSCPDFASLPPTIMILDASLRQRMIAEEVSRAKGFGASQVLAVWAQGRRVSGCRLEA